MATEVVTRFGVLGPLEVHRGSHLVSIGGPKQRTVLAALLLEPGRVVPAERIAEYIWGEELPERWQSTLQVYVYNLRRALRSQDGADAEDGVLKGRRPGYLVDADPSTLDLLQLE